MGRFGFIAKICRPEIDIAAQEYPPLGYPLVIRWTRFLPFIFQKENLMIFFDLRFGRFDILVIREALSAPFMVFREEPGTTIIEAKRFSIFLTNFRRT